VTRTFSRSDWEAAQASWAGFSPEWRDLRHAMALQGCIFAPSGTEWDSWEDDSPSQRAMLIRAVREQPALLARCVPGARSWQQLLERLLARRDDWREELAAREADAARQRAAEDAGRRAGASDAQSLASIIERLAASRGVSW
jgi:hypothetical protein